MKNLFRLSAVVLITGAIVSCSKSSDNLAGTDTGLSNAKMKRSREANASENWSTIYPAITEPRPTPLGNPDSYLFTDDRAVFYVVISQEAVSDAYTGTMDLTDDATGNLIGTYTMLPHTDPAAAGLLVPEEIRQSQLPFMFAVITLDSQYTGMTVSMQSTVQVQSTVGLPISNISQAWLPAAFTVQ